MMDGNQILTVDMVNLALLEAVPFAIILKVEVAIILLDWRC